jgi:Transposase DDE domain
MYTRFFASVHARSRTSRHIARLCCPGPDGRLRAKACRVRGGSRPWGPPTSWWNGSGRACPSWLTQEECEALPPSLVVREIRHTVSTPGLRTRQITLVTTLLDAEIYSVDDLAALYRTRWEVEMHLTQLKITMKMDILHCQTVPGVLKKLTVFAMVHNLVRMVMLQSAIHQQVAVERISFLDILRWLGAPGTGVGLEALRMNPARPNRVEPRVKKRRPKRFPFMVKPRHELRKSVIPQTLRA